METPENWDICSPARQDGEDYEAYRERIKLLKQVEKYYKRGRLSVQPQRKSIARVKSSGTDN